MDMDISEFNKPITENNSILYTREWVAKAKEEGHFVYLPNRKISSNFSLGQIIALKYWLNEFKEKQNEVPEDYLGYCKKI